jgi:hypothetical protein
MNRAIDRHEPAICEVYDAATAGRSYSEVLREVARAYELEPARLHQLVNTWCAVAGLPRPYECGAS